MFDYYFDFNAETQLKFEKKEKIPIFLQPVLEKLEAICTAYSIYSKI